ncbi:MAG: galactose mutarotase [Eubacteriales bacterium]|nr:galactose mutarotase [Eubacteriales bacterium]
MNISSRPFGVTADGERVTLYRLENSTGSIIELLDYGCTIRSLLVANREGRLTDVVLGYDTLREYEKNDGYLGAVVGRCANRIGGARFSLGGKEYHLAKNDGDNHLHGGLVGFDKRVWSAKINENGVVFSRTSSDGEEGYPSQLNIQVVYTFTDDNCLTIDYRATGDGDTIVNLTNHAYFALSGRGNVLLDELCVYANSFLENDAHCLPTGTILSAKGTPFDFSLPKLIGRDIGTANEQLDNAHGYDTNYLVGQSGKMKPVATLYSDRTGILMKVSTTQTGLQVYTANFLKDRAGKNGSHFGCRDAVCLETQLYPDAMAHPDWSSPVLKAGETYAHTTVYAFSLACK